MGCFGASSEKPIAPCPVQVSVACNDCGRPKDLDLAMARVEVVGLEGLQL